MRARTHGYALSVAQSVTAGANPINVKKGIDKACDYLVEQLKEVAKPIKGRKDIKVRKERARGWRGIHELAWGRKGSKGWRGKCSHAPGRTGSCAFVLVACKTEHKVISQVAPACVHDITCFL